MRKIMLVSIITLFVVLVASSSFADYQYWRQDDNTTKVWIKGNWSTTSKRIYWSNTSTYAPNGNNVFYFYDSFANTSKWTTNINDGLNTFTTSSGILTAYGNSAGADGRRAGTSIPRNSICQFRRSYSTAYFYPIGMGYVIDADNNIVIIGGSDADILLTIESGSLTNSGTYVSKSATYNEYKLVWKDTISLWYKDNVLKGNVTTNILADATAYPGFIDFTSGYFGLVDWVIYRKYSSVEPTVTCNQTGNYCDIVMSSGSVSDYQIILPITDTGNLRLYENIAPTTPTDISGFPVSLKVNDVMNVTASGSTDDGGSVSYFYKFYNVNDSTIRQDWSTTKTYTIQSSDAHDTIQVFVKATDGTLNSSEYNETDVVDNTVPATPSNLAVSAQYVGQDLSASCSATDVDSDSMTSYFEFYNINSSSTLQAYSTDNTYTIQVSDAHDTIRVRCKIYDGYGYSGEDTENIVTLDSNSSITINSPITNYHSNNNLRVNFTITDADGDTNNCNLLLNGSVSNSSSSIASGTTLALIGVTATNDIYSWYLSCTAYNTRNTTTRNFVFDDVNPEINFIYPLADNSTVLDNSLPLNIRVDDLYLYKVNLTIHNSSNALMYSNYSGAIDQQTYNFTGILNTTAWTEGIYNIYVEATDDHTYGELKLNKSKSTDRIIDFTDSQGTGIKIEPFFGNNIKKDKKPKIISSDIKEVKISEKLNKYINPTDDYVTEYKFSYNFTVEKNDDKIYFKLTSTDNSFKRMVSQGLLGHFIYSNKYYIDFQDADYIYVNGKKIKSKLEIIAYNSSEILISIDTDSKFKRGDTVYIDPVTGGLNIATMNVSFEVIHNQAPTTPTNIDVTPSPIIVSAEITASASGSSDIESDPITYYYKIDNLNDSTTVQDWSIDNTYIIQSTDLHNTLRIYVKAYDGDKYSSEYSEDYIVIVSESKTVTASLSYNDQLNRQTTLTKIPLISLSTSETTNRLLSANILKDDSLDFSDDNLINSNLFRKLDNPFSVLFNLLQTNGQLRKQQLSISFSSAVTRISSLTRLTSNILEINDITTRLSHITKINTYVINISTTTSKFLTIPRNIVDSISFNNMVSRLTMIFRSNHQSVTINSSTARTQLLDKIISNNLMISDSVNRLSAMFRNTQSHILIYDDLIAHSLFSRDSISTLDFNATTYRVSNRQRQILAQFNITESEYRLLLADVDSNTLLSLDTYTFRNAMLSKGLTQALSMDDDAIRVLMRVRSISQSLIMGMTISTLRNNVRTITQSIHAGVDYIIKLWRLIYTYDSSTNTTIISNTTTTITSGGGGSSVTKIVYINQTGTAPNLPEYNSWFSYGVYAVAILFFILVCIATDLGRRAKVLNWFNQASIILFIGILLAFGSIITSDLIQGVSIKFNIWLISISLLAFFLVLVSFVIDVTRKF